MRRARLVIAVLAAVATTAATPAFAQQSLTFTLFEKYLDSYREQFGIPALSVTVIQDGAIWGIGLGRQDLEANVAATADTPYFIGNLSQVFGSTLLLEKCYDQDTLELRDDVTRWVPDYPDRSTTVGQLLTHQSTSGAYAYDPGRFASLTAVIEECVDLPYRHILAGEIFERIGMTQSVPGRAFEGRENPGGASFSPAQVAHYNDVLNRMARHYRIDRGTPTRASVPAVPADAATGILSSARDLAEFDKALRLPGLLSRDALTLAWTQAGGTSPMPTGLGWFVQSYSDQNNNKEPLIWQFDLTRDVASSLIVKLPARNLTFIVLANSDGLTRTSNLAAGDALASPFVKLFLRFFAP